MEIDEAKIQNPENQYRLHMLMHSWDEEFLPQLERLKKGGVGGIVTNVPWNDNYLSDEEAFVFLNKVLVEAEKIGFKLWLYDEKGYPSGSADGLTLKDHPEYESRGIVCLIKEGNGFEPAEIELPEHLEKLLYAYALDEKNKALNVEMTQNYVRFDGTDGKWTLYAFAQKILFEGSHAQKCGWGPRRYPNIMDKAAIKEFICNTYEKYEKHIPDMGKRIDAFFTDEPSLMAGYINTQDTFPYAAYGWQEKLPEVFCSMHGYDIVPVLHCLFTGDSIEARTIKINYQQTVTFMITEAFFRQINQWCAERGIKFSGHNLLEESIGFHVVMNGDLFACLRNMSWPGVDILTCDPELYKKGDFHYMMAAKFVGSAARCAGTSERVMVEICPVSGLPKEGYFSLEQLIGTMDLIFFAGINHINSYISADRFGENINYYTDYFARVAYMLRDAKWDGEIAMYYPIEAAQSLHKPINRSCSEFGSELFLLQDIMRNTAVELHSRQLDYNIIDTQWLNESRIINDTITSGDLTFKIIIMPYTIALSLDTLKKLLAFQNSGGTVLWIGAKPNMGLKWSEHEEVRKLSESIVLCENAAETAKNVIIEELKAESTEQESLWISRYKKEDAFVYYILNTSDNENKVTITDNDFSKLKIISNRDGSIASFDNTAEITMIPYSSVILIAQK